MPHFYLSKDLNQNFEHEVHKESCLFLPNKTENIALGKFKSPKEAFKSGKKIIDKINGCYWCCKEIHTYRIPFYFELKKSQAAILE